MQKRKPAIMLLLTIIMAMTIFACDSGNKDSDDPQKPDTYQGNGNLSLAADFPAVESYFRENAINRIKRDFNNYREWSNSIYPDSPGTESDSASDGASSDSSDLQYSETNVQEKGVDEADTVKTDGNYLYVLNGKYFCILKSWPADELGLASKTTLDYNPQDLYVSGNQAVIISNTYSYGNETLPFETDSYILTAVSIYDITDRTAPVLQKQTFFEGYYMTSRKIGDLVHVLVDFEMYQLSPYYLIGRHDFSNFTYDDLWAGNEDLEAAMIEYVNSCQIEDLMPKAFDVPVNGAAQTGITGTAQIDKCYLPETPNGDDIVSINTFDLADLSGDISTVSLVANSGEVYASTQNLYIASQNCRYWYWYEWDQDSGWTEKTYIYKFSLGADPGYVACGEVDGYAINQFSMGEYDGYFRIATTTNLWNWWDTEAASNNLYVLRQNGDTLSVAGKIENIAEGESIYAVRFMGARGFIVTYRQVDPLFCVDLSNPEKPEIKGELEMPGYSSYLHPVGENHLIGVGMNVGESGWVNNLQVSLFDVSDLANPTKAASINIGSDWSWSEAMYEHKAFQYYEPLGMLSIPVETWSWDGVTDNFFNGALVMKISTDPASIEQLGEISHSNFYKPEQGWWNWNREVRRTVFIGSQADGFYIYTVSGVGVKVNDADDIDTVVATQELPFDWVDFWCYGEIMPEI